MRARGLVAALPLILTFGTFAPVRAQESGVVVERFHPDGAPSERFTTAVDANGQVVRHGDYRAWHANGGAAAEGAYENGQRTGRWTLRHDNGKREALGSYRSGARFGKWILFHRSGKKRAEGKYVDGGRNGRWKFWHADGTPDGANSGEYSTVVLLHADGGERTRGEKRNGRWHGDWIFRWPGGRPAFEGVYVDGRRAGEWRFYHLDGTHDPSMLSGIYEGGSKPETLIVDDPITRPDGAPPLEEIPALYGVGPAEGLLGRDVEAYLSATDHAERKAALGRIVATGRDAVPELVRRMCAEVAADPAAAGGVRLRHGAALRAICTGQEFPWESAEGRGDTDLVLIALRWLSLWALTREADDFWGLDLALAPLKPVSRALVTGSLLDPLLHDPVDGPAYQGASLRSIYSARFAERERDLAEMALEDALAWLARQQSADGAFRHGVSEGGSHPHDVGLTGLALLSFLSAGHTTSHGLHRDAVLRGVRWILAQQDRGGLFPRRATFDYMYDHAIAVLALSEAAAFCPSPRLRSGLQRGVDVLVKARNPFGAWRYAQTPDGKNDTSMTCWVLQALVAARWVELDVDADAFAGGLSWIDEMTDDSTGRIGYDSTGSLSARTNENEGFSREAGEALTAAGLFAELLLGREQEQPGLREKQALLIHRRTAIWDPKSGMSDMYFWFYASQAAALVGGSLQASWRAPLLEAAISGQSRGGAEAGSWDPVGPWGYKGGRIYSTTMAVLSLTAPRRFRLPPAGR